MFKPTYLVFPLFLLISSVAGFSQSLIEYPSFGSGLRCMAKDSSATVKISARIQNLVVVTKSLNNSNDPSISASVRRARLKFDGYALSPKLVYKIELGLSSQDTRYSSDASIVGGTARIIFDAVLKYQYSQSSSLWFGQTKLPGNRERVISSQKLQFVDRSLVNAMFNLDRDVGIQHHSKYRMGNVEIRVIEAVSMGEGRNVIAGNSGGLDYTGRIEVLPFGSFTNKGDYFGSDLEREPSPKLSVALTADYNQGASRTRGQLGGLMVDSTGAFLTSDLVSFHADFMFKYRGFSWHSEAASRKSSNPNLRDVNNQVFATGFGINSQIGYVFRNNIEIASRYTKLVPWKDQVTRGMAEHEQYSAAVSKYFKSHNLKLQTDLTYGRFLGNTFVSDYLMFRVQTELSF